MKRSRLLVLLTAALVTLMPDPSPHGGARAWASGHLGDIRILSNSPEFFAGRETRLAVVIANRGHLTWSSLASDPAHPVRVSYHWMNPDGRIVVFDGLRTELPNDLEPGRELVVRMSVLAPPEPGTYTLVLDLVREHVTWFAQEGRSALRISPVTVLREGAITWQRSRILIITGAALVLLFAMGFGAARLLAPDVPLMLTPLVGAAVLIALGYYASVFRIPMKSARLGILAVGIGAAAVSMIGRRVSPRIRWGETVLLGLLALAMLILTLWPLWVFGRPSTVQNTYASYFVVMSDYWRAHTLWDVPGLDPRQPLDYLVRERLVHRYVTGTPFLNAFIGSSLGLPSHETYSILTAILLALLPPGLYWVARSAFGLTAGASAVAALLSLANVTYLLWSFRGQMTFVAGILFLPLGIRAGALLIEGKGNVLLAALFLSTVFAVYPPLAPYALVVLLLFGGLLVLQATVRLRAVVLAGLKLLGVLVLVNPVVVFNGVVAGLSGASQISENWHNIPAFPSLAEFLGLLPHFSPDAVGPTLGLLASGFVPIALAVMGYGLYRAWKGGHPLLVTAAVPYLAGFLVIYFVMDYAYGYYKHGVVTLFAFLFALSAGLEGLWKKGIAGKCAALACGGTFLLLTLSTLRISFATALPRFVPPELVSVGDVRRLVNKRDVVFLDQHDVALQLWTSYFLWGVPLSVPPAFEPWGWWGFSSVSGRGEPRRFYEPRATYTLTRWDEITRPRGAPIWSNSVYLLYAGSPALSIGEGWHDLEGGASMFRWMTGEGMLTLTPGGFPNRTVSLKLVLQPIVSPLTIEVLVGDERVGTFQLREPSRPVVLLTRPFAVTRDTTVRVRSLEGCFVPVRLGGGSDHRCLSVAVRELTAIDDAR
jgi:hypothetical protein